MDVVRPAAHAETIERLWRAAAADRLPHSLLFEGPTGIGKYQAAKWFAQGLLCSRGPGLPCGECGPCKQVLSGLVRGNHPDLFVLDPADPVLAKDFERGSAWRVSRIAYRPGSDGIEDPEYCLEHALGLRSLQGERRVVLLREAQRMNESAQNALLKTLEEPRPGTVLVLETHLGAQLLATIKSRCIRIRFEPLTLEQCEGVLVGIGRAPEVARELALLSRGSPGRALEQERTRLMELREALSDAAVGRTGPLAAVQRILETEAEYPGGAPAQERGRVRAVGELAQAMLLDGLRRSAGVDPAVLVHGVVASELARMGERELRQRLDLVGLGLADLTRNLTPAVVLERMVLALAEGASAPAGIP